MDDVLVVVIVGVVVGVVVGAGVVVEKEIAKVEIVDENS